MARHTFKTISVHRESDGVEYKAQVQPPDLDLPWGVRLAVWVLRPVLRRVLTWVQQSVLTLLVQLNVPKGKRLAVVDLFDQLRVFLDEII